MTFSQIMLAVEVTAKIVHLARQITDPELRRQAKELYDDVRLTIKRGALSDAQRKRLEKILGKDPSEYFEEV